MESMPDIKIFGGSSGKDFAQKICDYLNIPLAEGIVHKFEDGNIFVKSCETVRMKDVYLVQSIGMNPNDEFTEILFWMDAFKRASARTVTVVLPYFGYAKGDKKDEPRVSIRARVCAESIELAGADRVITMDLHSPQIQGFFKKPVDHIIAMPLFCEYLKRCNFINPVVVSPDAGFAKQARKYAEMLGIPVAIGDKMRTDYDSDASILEIIGEVKGKTAIIVDDFTITGGTLINIADALEKRGAKRIVACLSHMLIREKNIERLMNCQIEQIITTDSVYNSLFKNNSKIKAISVAPVFAELIHCLQKSESVSSVFSNVSDKIISHSF